MINTHNRKAVVARDGRSITVLGKDGKELLDACKWALAAERALPDGMRHPELERALEAAIAKAEEPPDIFKYGVGDAEKSQAPKYRG